MDFLFLEFYIMKKYGQRVEEYFSVNKVSVSNWRTKSHIPPQRLIEFHEREGSLNMMDLFKSLYKDQL